MAQTNTPATPPVPQPAIDAEIARMQTQGRAGKRASISDAADDGIEIALRSVGQGNLNSRISDALWGLNCMPTPMALMHNTDQYGYVFFTRPSLNLTYDNLIRNDAREFISLLDQDPGSMGRAIRAMLDPLGSEKAYPSSRIDPQQIFLPLLSNTCTNLSGWPDPQISTYTSTAGAYKESWTMYDGTIKLLGEYNLNATFSNTVNDPISILFQMWTSYGSYVYDDTMTPALMAIIQRYMDYQTRIYRIVMDYSYTKVQKIAVAEVAIPTTFSLGPSFDFSRDHPRNEQLDQISVSFAANGIRYNDPILLTEFNMAVQLKCPSMRDKVRHALMTRVPISQKALFNCHMYPRIDPYTRNFEWWVTAADYKAQVGYSSFSAILADLEHVKPNTIASLIVAQNGITGETDANNVIETPKVSTTSSPLHVPSTLRGSGLPTS